MGLTVPSLPGIAATLTALNAAPRRVFVGALLPSRELDARQREEIPSAELPLTGILVILLVLAALTACSDPTPTPKAADSPTPSTIAATSPPPANITEPEDQIATAAPTETETPTPSPTTAPSLIISPTPEPTAATKTDGRLAPLRLHDSRALRSELSDTELACIGHAPETMARALAGSGPGSRDALLRLIVCLNDENLARLSQAGFITGPEPLSPETSD